MKTTQWHLKHSRRVTELLFSVNFVFHVLSVASIRLPYPAWLYLLSPGRSLVSIVHQIFPIPKALRDADLNVQYFLGSVLVWSALVFLIFRIASRLSPSDVVLRNLAGVTGVVALPLAVRYSGRVRLDAPDWLLFEILPAVILTVLFQSGFLRKNFLLMLLLAAHFVLWGWAVVPSWFWPVYPILGFGATAVWGAYLQRLPSQPTVRDMGRRLAKAGSSRHWRVGAAAYNCLPLANR